MKIFFLIKNNFQQLSNNDFKIKIEKVFRRTLDFNSNTNFIKIDPFIGGKCNYKLIFKPYSSNDNYLYIDKNNKLITYFIPLPRIIDYRSKFPYLSKFEEKDIYIYDNIEDENIKISKWKNEIDLDQQIHFNEQLLIHRNKYLFNDNKASLAWLKFNDEYFLESLVKTFGYTEDKDLLDWYIKNNGLEKHVNNKEEYLKAFYIKNCDKSFEIHTETFTVIDSYPEKYSTEILSVLDDIRTDRIKLGELNFKEKSKLIAYLLYFGEKHKEKTGLTFAFMGKFYKHSSEDLQKKYDEEFRKNNFYGLSNFEKLWNDAKVEGDGLDLDM